MRLTRQDYSGAAGAWHPPRPYRSPDGVGTAGAGHYRGPVLLSDRDIRAELESGRVALEPYEPEMIQPSSIDVRLDRYFRLFDNHKYPVIDPAAEQPDLTRLVDVPTGESFVLHPG